MKALTLSAGRRRDQVVILTGVRPGSKLSTSTASVGRALSPLALFALKMLGALALGVALLGLSLIDGRLGALASFGALIALLLTLRKGGAL